MTSTFSSWINNTTVEAVIGIENPMATSFLLAFLSISAFAMRSVLLCYHSEVQRITDYFTVAANVYLKRALRLLREHILMFVFMDIVDRHTLVFQSAPSLQGICWAMYTVFFCMTDDTV